MNDEKMNIQEYLNNLSLKLSKRKLVARSKKMLNDFPLALGQSLYLMNFQTQQITFQKGIREMLGYSEEEFDFNLTCSYFHPDDQETLNRLIKATLAFASENFVEKEVSFVLTYRIRKKNGSYIKVMRQSNTFECDEEGKIISNLSVLTDIDFLKTGNKVEWRFDAPGLDQQKFREYIAKEFSGFFTKRESEIARWLRKGLSSTEIGNKIYLSKHTVDTHRRNMLKKSKSKNTVELINFCEVNGII